MLTREQIATRAARDLESGETVHLGIASHPRQAVLSAHAMTPATVVRSDRDGAHHRVAVRMHPPMTTDRPLAA